MQRKRRPLTTLRFGGGRFENSDGYLEIDVLPELIAYKKSIVETAKSEWRKRNPDKLRLPKRYVEGIRLVFHEIRPGSTEIPLEQEELIEEEDLGLEFGNEVENAVRIIDISFEALSRSLPLPNDLPPEAITHLKEIGKTLREDEYIEYKSKSATKPVRFSHAHRINLAQRCDSRLEQEKQLTGEVRSASLRKEGGAFSMVLDDGTKIEGRFDSDQEAMVTEALHLHESVRLHISGLVELNGDGKPSKVVNIRNLSIDDQAAFVYDETVEPIWKRIVALGKSIPEEDWKSVPTDLATNLDHYLYGSPKVDE